MADLLGNKKPIARVGIIGCGNIASILDEKSSASDFAKTHAKAYRQDLRFDLAALCDLNDSRLLTAQQAWSVKFATTRIEEFLAQNLDIVSLCTPVEMQLELLKKILEHKVKVVFCEKPLGRNLVEAEQILKVVERSASIVAVNYIRRYDSEIVAIKKEILEKCLDVQKVVCHYGKGLLNNGSHLIDLLVYFFGLPSRVRYIDTCKDDREDSDDPSMSAVFYYEGPAAFSVYLTAQDHRNFSNLEMDIFMREGRTQILDSGREILKFRAVTDRDYPDYKSLGLVAHLQGGLKHVLALGCGEMYELWRDQKVAPTSPVQDSIAIHRIIEAIKKSKERNEVARCQ